MFVVNLFGAYIEPEIIAMLSIMSIPLTALIGHFYLKAQKLKLQAGSQIQDKDIRFIKAKLQENEELKEEVKELKDKLHQIERQNLLE